MTRNFNLPNGCLASDIDYEDGEEQIDPIQHELDRLDEKGDQDRDLSYE